MQSSRFTTPMAVAVLAALALTAVLVARPAGAQDAATVTLTGDLRCQEGLPGGYAAVFQLVNPGETEVTVTSATVTGIQPADALFSPNPVPPGQTAFSFGAIPSTPAGGEVTMTVVVDGETLVHTLDVPGGPCVPPTTQGLTGSVSCTADGDPLVTWTTRNSTGATVLSFAGRTRGLVVGDIAFTPEAVAPGGTSQAVTVVPAEAGPGEVIVTVSFSNRETALAFVTIGDEPCPRPATTTSPAAAAVAARPAFTG
jgi:hypothetical protein